VRAAWLASAVLAAGSVLVGACSFGTDGTSTDAGAFDAASADVTFQLPEAGAADSADAMPFADAGHDASPDAGPETGAAEAGPTCSFGAACAPGACQVGVTQCDGGTQFCQPVGDTTAGVACGDGGVCNGSGTCNACSPGADCTDAGSCARFSVVCTSGAPVCSPAGNEPNGTPCGKDLYCTAGACTACTPDAGCVPSGKPCEVGVVSCSAGFACSDTGSPAGDGTACGTNQVCKSGQCVACTSGASCTPNGNACQTGTTSCATGAQVCGSVVDVANGTPCGNGEVCHGGQCVACQTGAACTPPGNLCDKGTIACTTGVPVCVDTGAPAVTCTASDQCHVAGTCDPASGKCSNPAAGNGTPCNDGDACTTGDQCAGGVCGGTAVTCTASDQCHLAGTCDPSSGNCSNPAAGNGTPCNDGDACTTGDQCTGGTCGGTPVTCTASDQCHLVGTCDPSSGNCSNPVAGNGTSCNDGDPCTTGDQCTAGTCGGTPVSCVASDECHVAGTCSGGVCSNPTAGNGTPCQGGNGSCQAGTCTCNNPLVMCGTTCVDIFTDDNNCNGCGNKCPVLASPSGGATCTQIQASGVCVGRVGGFASAGGSSPGVTGRLIYAMQISMPKGGKVVALDVILTGGGIPTSAVMGLYQDNNGVPGTLLMGTGQATIGLGDDALALNTQITLDPGTYWVALSTSGSNQENVQSSSGTCVTAEWAFGNGVPNAWPTTPRGTCPPMGLYALTDF